MGGKEGKGGEGGREGKGEGRGGEREEDVEGSGKWSAPGPVLALGGPGLHVSFLLHVKYTVSYCIVAFIRFDSFLMYTVA